MKKFDSRMEIENKYTQSFQNRTKISKEKNRIILKARKEGYLLNFCGKTNLKSLKAFENSTLKEKSTIIMWAPTLFCVTQSGRFSLKKNGEIYLKNEFKHIYKNKGRYNIKYLNRYVRSLIFQTKGQYFFDQRTTMKVESIIFLLDVISPLCVERLFVSKPVFNPGTSDYALKMLYDLKKSIEMIKFSFLSYSDSFCRLKEYIIDFNKRKEVVETYFVVLDKEIPEETKKITQDLFLMQEELFVNPVKLSPKSYFQKMFPDAPEPKDPMSFNTSLVETGDKILKIEGLTLKERNKEIIIDDYKTRMQLDLNVESELKIKDEFTRIIILTLKRRINKGINPPDDEKFYSLIKKAAQKGLCTVRETGIRFKTGHEIKKSYLKLFESKYKKLFAAKTEIFKGDDVIEIEDALTKNLIHKYQELGDFEKLESLNARIGIEKISLDQKLILNVKAFVSNQMDEIMSMKHSDFEEEYANCIKANSNKFFGVSNTSDAFLEVIYNLILKKKEAGEMAKVRGVKAIFIETINEKLTKNIVKNLYDRFREPQIKKMLNEISNSIFEKEYADILTSSNWKEYLNKWKKFFMQTEPLERKVKSFAKIPYLSMEESEKIIKKLNEHTYGRYSVTDEAIEKASRADEKIKYVEFIQKLIDEQNKQKLEDIFEKEMNTQNVFLKILRLSIMMQINLNKQGIYNENVKKHLSKLKENVKKNFPITLSQNIYLKILELNEESGGENTLRLIYDYYFCLKDYSVADILDGFSDQRLFTKVMNCQNAFLSNKKKGLLYAGSIKFENISEMKKIYKICEDFAEEKYDDYLYPIKTLILRKPGYEIINVYLVKAHDRVKAGEIKIEKGLMRTYFNKLLKESDTIPFNLDTNNLLEYLWAVGYQKMSLKMQTIEIFPVEEQSDDKNEMEEEGPNKKIKLSKPSDLNDDLFQKMLNEAGKFD